MELRLVVRVMNKDGFEVQIMKLYNLLGYYNQQDGDYCPENYK